MATRRLYIKTIDANGEEKPFPLKGIQAELTDFTYSASRMGNAPSLSGTVTYPRCLDADWTHKEFVEYNGERFIVEQVPSSSKDDSSFTFNHTIELYSARHILDNVFFFDAVKNDTGDVYRSNMTSFTFSGTIEQFKDRLNASLDYCGLYDEQDLDGYCVVIDEGLADGTIKELSFEDKYILEAIQEIYNTFELPYYWVGRKCHVGWAENILTSPLKYGVKDALLNIQKENANNAIIDAITGHGGSDNIEYYYPNTNPFGTAEFETSNFDASSVASIDLETAVKWEGDIFNNALQLCSFASETYSAQLRTATAKVETFYKRAFIKSTWHGLDVVTDNGGIDGTSSFFSEGDESYFQEFGTTLHFFKIEGKKLIGSIDFSQFKAKIENVTAYSYDSDAKETSGITPAEHEFRTSSMYFISDTLTLKELEIKVLELEDSTDITITDFLANNPAIKAYYLGNYDGYDNVPIYMDGEISLCVRTRMMAKIQRGFTYNILNKFAVTFPNSVVYNITPPGKLFVRAERTGHAATLGESGITLTNTESIPFKPYGYSLVDGAWVESEVATEALTASITITGRKWITPSQYLMPSVYRESFGAERFLYALDNTHLLPDSTTEYYSFTNKFVKGNPHQGSVSFEDIKPTIKGMTNSDGQLLGEVADVAYDSNDSDSTDESGTYIHQYFYIKLHRFSGDGGFDLFKSALASSNMTLNMIDCQGCPSCAFPIKAVTSDNATFYNCVSTDGNGNLVAVKKEEDKDDYILSTSEAMADTKNQDSTEKEIWVCVQKDSTTLGLVMPNVLQNLKVKKGDQFVITGISLPQSYITDAEHRLDAALVKNMKENNEEKFDFSVKFSRIFLKENPTFAANLNENARLVVEYCGVQRILYVSSYTVKADGEVLDEVSVELTDELSTAQSTTLQRINEIKGDTLDSVTKMLKTADLINISSKFLFKDRADTASGLVTFAAGLVAKAAARLEQGMTVGEGGVYGMDGEGKAKASDIEAVTGKIITAVVDYLQSSDYNTTEQTGFGFYKKSGGRYGLNVTDLMVWGKAVFNSLEIRKLYSVGGNIVLSPTASKIFKATPYYETASDGTQTQTGWKCWLLADDGTMATTNQWQTDDQARCQTFDIAEGTYEGVANKNYWRRVTAVSTANEQIIDPDSGTALYDGQKYAWVVLSKDDCLAGSDEPQAGDTIVCMGNRNSTGDKADRANLIMLETVGEDAPMIALYRRVFGYSLEQTCVFKLGYNGVSVVSKYFNWVSASGDREWHAVYLGEWDSSRTYYYYEEVTHRGTRWLCIAPADGEGTQSEPSETNDLWMATTAIQREKLLLELSGQDTLDWGESITVTAAVYLGDTAVDTSSGWEWSVVRDSGDSTEDAAWNASSKAQQFRGTITIAFNATENDLGEERQGVYGTVFTFKAWQTGSKAEAVSATLSI